MAVNHVAVNLSVQGFVGVSLSNLGGTRTLWTSFFLILPNACGQGVIELVTGGLLYRVT